MFRKTMRILYWFVPILLVSLCPLLLHAQRTAAPENQEQAAAQESAQHTEHVTGCLQKGDEAGEFSVKGEDGKIWGLRSRKVNLSDHVGHKVTVTGSPSHESKAAEKAEEKKEGQVEKAAGKEEYRDLNVTDLTMISKTCEQH